MGEGWVEDVTTHPATRAMVEEYVAWYDRHLDPDVAGRAAGPGEGRRERGAVGLSSCRRSSEDLIGMGRSFAKTIFLSAGNITHTPAYGNLIALGVLTAVQAHERLGQSRSPTRWPIASGSPAPAAFMTYCGGARSSASACSRTRPTASR